MRLKTLAMLAIVGLASTSLVYADDMSNSSNSSATNSENVAVPSNGSDTSAAMNSASTNNSSNSSSNDMSNDDMNADTATGDDDY